MVQPIHRKVIQTSYREFQQSVDTYKTNFKKIFFKTAKKSHNRCVLNYFGNIEIDGKMFCNKATIMEYIFR